MQPLKAEEMYDRIEDGRIEVSVRWATSELQQLTARVQWLRKALGLPPLISEDRLEKHIEEWVKRNR